MSGKRQDVAEYPLTAIREILLNALVHRDYSTHTEGMPIQLQIFSDRIEIFSNNYNFIKHKINKTLINFKILRNKIKYILFKKEKYKNKINYLYSIKENEILHDKMKKNLIKKIKKYSKADVCYSLFISLKLGKYFNCPKFVQVHDLFTIPLFDLFKDDFGGEKSLKKTNNQFLENLKEYAEKDSIFISSSEYVAKNHSLKYIVVLSHGVRRSGSQGNCREMVGAVGCKKTARQRADSALQAYKDA